MTRRRKNKQWALWIEAIMGSLVAVSITFLAIDLFGHPTPEQSFWIEHTDLAIACIFLTEFVIRLATARKPLQFLKGNWYLLVASIPISVPGTEIFRLLRLERILRIIRVMDHVAEASRR
jgi:hypothetical protein